MSLLTPTIVYSSLTPAAHADPSAASPPVGDTPVRSLNTLEMLTESMRSAKRPRPDPGTPSESSSAAESSSVKRARLELENPEYETRSTDPHYRVNQKGKPVESCAITWSHAVESDPSAQSVGERGTALDYDDVADLHEHLRQEFSCEFIDMSTFDPKNNAPVKACVLIVRGYFDNAIFDELLTVKPAYVDRHMWSYGKCKNKNARWNTNMTDEAAEGDIPNPDPKKRCSSQIPFDEYPAAKRARKSLHELGIKAGLDLKDLKMEVNYYFPKGYIGRHGDVERNLVIGGSVGTSDRVIQWCEYYRSKPGKTYQAVLKPGDMYIMCGKASGVDWKKSSIPTFRHCAGSQAFVDKVTADAIKRKRAAPAAPAAKRRKTKRDVAIQKVKTKLKTMPGQVTIEEWLHYFGDRLPADENMSATKIQKIVRGFLTRRPPVLPEGWSGMNRLRRIEYAYHNYWTPQQWVVSK